LAIMIITFHIPYMVHLVSTVQIYGVAVECRQRAAEDADAGPLSDRHLKSQCLQGCNYFLAALTLLCRFYRAMHFSAKRGIAIVCRPSVRPSVCLSVTFRYRDHIGSNSSKIISRPNSSRPVLGPSPTWAIWCNGNTPKIRVE